MRETERGRCLTGRGGIAGMLRTLLGLIRDLARCRRAIAPAEWALIAASIMVAVAVALPEANTPLHTVYTMISTAAP